MVEVASSGCPSAASGADAGDHKQLRRHPAHSPDPSNLIHIGLCCRNTETRWAWGEVGAQCGALDSLISRSHRGHEVPLGIGPQQLPAPWVRRNHLTEVVTAHGQERGGVEVADRGGAAELLSDQRHQLRRAMRPPSSFRRQTILNARMGEWRRTAFNTAQSCSSKCRAFVLPQQLPFHVSHRPQTTDAFGRVRASKRTRRCGTGWTSSACARAHPGGRGSSPRAPRAPCAAPPARAPHRPGYLRSIG